MFKKIILGAVLASAMIMAGCSSKHASIDEVQAQVQVVGQKVDALENKVVALRKDTDEAKAEAVRANQRLDNQATAYRK